MADGLSIPRVVLTIKGGVAEVLLKPRGVALTILDYDVEGEEGLEVDPDGRPCRIAEWAAGRGIVKQAHWPVVRSAPRDVPSPETHTWRCPSCAATVEHSYDDLADVGTPICDDCDVEMEMV